MKNFDQILKLSNKKVENLLNSRKNRGKANLFAAKSLKKKILKTITSKRQKNSLKRPNNTMIVPQGVRSRHAKRHKS